MTKDEHDVSKSWFEEVFGRGKGIEQFSYFVNNDYADFGIPQVCELDINPVDVEEAPF